MNHPLSVAAQLLTNTAGGSVAQTPTYACLHWGCCYQGVILGLKLNPWIWPAWLWAADGHQAALTGYKGRIKRSSNRREFDWNGYHDLDCCQNIWTTAIWGYCGFMHHTWTSICHDVQRFATVCHDWSTMIYCGLPSCTTTLPSCAMCCAMVCHYLYAMISHSQPGTVTNQHEPSSFAPYFTILKRQSWWMTIIIRWCVARSISIINHYQPFIYNYQAVWNH